jgi:hypothetical protein
MIFLVKKKADLNNRPAFFFKLIYKSITGFPLANLSWRNNASR